MAIVSVKYSIYCPTSHIAEISGFFLVPFCLFVELIQDEKLFSI